MTECGQMINYGSTPCDICKCVHHNLFRMPELFAGKNVNYRVFFKKDVMTGYEKL